MKRIALDIFLFTLGVILTPFAWFIWIRMKYNRVNAIEAPRCSLGYGDGELP